MPNLLTTTEAATALGVTPRRVQALIKAGRLPATRFGKSFAIKPADLEKVRIRPVGRPEKTK